MIVKRTLDVFVVTAIFYEWSLFLPRSAACCTFNFMFACFFFVYYYLFHFTEIFCISQLKTTCHKNKICFVCLPICKPKRLKPFVVCIKQFVPKQKVICFTKTCKRHHKKTLYKMEKRNQFLLPFFIQQNHRTMSTYSNST